jgi:hypothetical protein
MSTVFQMANFLVDEKKAEMSRRGNIEVDRLFSMSASRLFGRQLVLWEQEVCKKARCNCIVIQVIFKFSNELWDMPLITRKAGSGTHFARAANHCSFSGI